MSDRTTSGFAILRLKCFYQHLCLVDSEVLRIPRLR